MTRSSLRLLLALAPLLACDRGVPIPGDDVAPLHLVDVNIGPQRALILGDPIELAFDRYLDPASATRQSFAVVDGFGTLAPTPQVDYDPETRTVRISAASDPWLLADQPYTLIVGIPQPGEFLGGVRGLDGGTLTPDQNLRIAFMVREGQARAPSPPVSVCEQIQPLLTRACASCHDGTTLGLDLRDADGLQRTALRKVARGSVTSPLSQPTGVGFGNATLLAPPSAATSYLLDKILLHAPGTHESRASCTQPQTQDEPLAVQIIEDPGDIERARLRERVHGMAMPPTDSGIAPLSLHERRVLSRWIREGSPLATCTETCP